MQSRAALIHAALYGMVPPIVRSDADAQMYGLEGREYLIADEASARRPLTAGACPVHGSENYYKENVDPVLPELDAIIEAPNVKKALTALLGPGYMVDSTRGAHYTIPNRHTQQDFHRDGAEKRRHHKTRMLMGLYYPQDTTVEMGATHIVARSHMISDFDPGFQDYRVLASPRRTTSEAKGKPNINKGGDYLGTG
eukprot:SAG31_NODE_2019_length_6660_cov_2.597775_7_plen_196_part_00